jgi:hypothetical protein
MDVHKDSVTACVMLIDESGEWRSEKLKFRTMTRDLRPRRQTTLAGY